MSAPMLGVSLLGVGTVLRLARDAWSMVELLKQTTTEYAPPPTLVVDVWPFQRSRQVRPLTRPKLLNKKNGPQIDSCVISGKGELGNNPYRSSVTFVRSYD